ncbi:hypothetical protein B484DRAFT_113334 [Ochromonadaceae sp. CCMP2298]|nr:hypothetical protein B484DRAFT_113334 [Ochromonadaceae sp. CCMP2298]
MLHPVDCSPCTLLVGDTIIYTLMYKCITLYIQVIHLLYAFTFMCIYIPFPHYTTYHALPPTPIKPSHTHTYLLNPPTLTPIKPFHTVPHSFKFLLNRHYSYLCTL